ncbi:MAG: ATPase, T2SS/T4P/T4SS family [Pseudomonadota bacterium]
MLDQTPYDKLTELSKQLDAVQGLGRSYRQVEKLILKAFDASRMSLFQRRRQHQDLVARFKTGKEVNIIKVPISPQSVAGYVAMAQQPVMIDDAYDEEQLRSIHFRLRFDKKYDLATNFKTTSILCVPIIRAGLLMGVMQIINKNNGSFDQRDHTLAIKVAELLANKFRYELGGTKHPFDFLILNGQISQSTIDEISESNDQRTIVQRIMGEYRVPEDAVGEALSIYYQVPYINYSPEDFYLHQGNSKMNKSYLKRNFIAVVSDVRGNPIVLMLEPNNSELLMEIESALGIDNYEIAVSLPNNILKYLGVGADKEEEEQEEIDELMDYESIMVDDEKEHEPGEEDTPAIVKLVNKILQDAKRWNASDIHVDPEKSGPTKVRMRIDGIIRDVTQIPARHHSAAIARIKILSGLNIAEKRVPQDGKLAFRVAGQTVEVRVATIPTVAGEGAVMRILATGGAMPLEKMNLMDSNLNRLNGMIKKPHGILLVVGPTGSGKTTTLHAVLGHLNTPERKIWTAEDPVEITQPGLQQVQVTPKIGFNFAAALRAFLRADPDIILIGEMRDKETAHAGIEASLTGHLVLSTLHTNSAPETITRLLDLGLDPVNFSDACVGILAQRLMRTLCPNCKEPYKASEDDYKFLKRQYGEEWFDELGIDENVTLHRGKGCEECGNTGYKGRTGAHELLEMTNELRALVYKEASVSELKKQAMTDGMRTLVQDAVQKVIKGDTDIFQVQILSGHD